jgi:hypothetical protein
MNQEWAWGIQMGNYMYIYEEGMEMVVAVRRGDGRG